MKLSLSSPQSDIKSMVVIEPEAIKLLPDYSRGHTKLIVVADKNAYSHLHDYLDQYVAAGKDLIELEISEKAKDLKTVEAVLRELKARGCDRKSLVVAIGGGVLCDAVGYAASSYMRGIQWIAIPTTLIAQADAAIGGKTGVNLEEYKNLIGAFWQPKAVLVDPNMLKTLPERHIKAGLAEIVKMGFIDNKQIVELFNSSETNDVLTQLIELSAEGKVSIVNDDPMESGERKLLNFGHTLGHAFESLSLATSEPLLHGEAISIGMVAETKLAELEGVCAPELTKTIQEILTKIGLPTSSSSQDRDEILKRVVLDKKNEGGKTLWTLPKEVGRGIYNHQAREENIISAIDFVTK
ncbi:3-dehydroquinate synthase [Candidatus Saccharibacteria bacterium]|nr:3-dehydroquinate synthase [Candidatus Saccharibacteria bacterium]